MEKLIILIPLIFILSACGGWDRTVANVTGYSTRCIDDVKYIQFTSGVTVKYRKDGMVETC